ncbi:MAG: hypothetical protein IID54_02815 [Proteobacteria bacterium]|nr:hypothetical protein [Pseudomonadota bacterium]
MTELRARIRNVGALEMEVVMRTFLAAVAVFALTIPVAAHAVPNLQTQEHMAEAASAASMQSGGLTYTQVAQARNPRAQRGGRAASAKVSGRSARVPARSAKAFGRSAKVFGHSARVPARSAKVFGRSAKAFGRSAKVFGPSAKAPKARAGHVRTRKTLHGLMHGLTFGPTDQNRPGPIAGHGGNGPHNAITMQLLGLLRAITRRLPGLPHGTIHRPLHAPDHGTIHGPT